ncbi:hypothetical protein GCM10010988_38750 [Cnuibacter physcomitrellae]|nr:hypothetical protein GCM10010988_38750 [Cnuibacter physcomitrellae]
MRLIREVAVSDHHGGGTRLAVTGHARGDGVHGQQARDDCQDDAEKQDRSLKRSGAQDYGP